MEQSQTVTNLAFVINMINSCIGVGLLAKPYALMIAGWYSIISVVMAFCFITYSGYLFAKVTFKANDISPNTAIQTTSYYKMDNMNPENDEKKVCENKKSVFQIIGYKALGKYGEYYVNISLTTILFIVCISLLIIEYELLSQIINTEKYTFIYIFLMTLPMIFILNWRQLTFVGYISVSSIIIITLTIFSLFIICMDTFHGKSVPNTYFENDNNQNTAKYAIDNMSLFKRIFFSFITIKSGIAGTFAIPPLIMALKIKSWRNIRRLIFISYLLVTIFCVLFGLFGALIYGENVSILILNNIFIWPSGIMVNIVSFIKIINLWSSYGILLSILTQNLLINHNNNKLKQYLIRFCILLFTSIIAYLSRNHLAFIISIQGIISSMIGGATMLPLILYIAMFYNEMTMWSKAFHFILIAFVICIAIVVLTGTSALV